MLVKGGPASSGTKVALREKPTQEWTCRCGRTHKPYIASCSNPECRDRRP